MLQKKGLAAALAAATLMMSGVASAGETVGVDVHYESPENSGDSWAGRLSYARLFVSNLEAGGAYTFRGSDNGGTVQGLQLIGRQWFGPYPKRDTVTPFVELGVGLEFAHGQYENVLAAGFGIGMFVSQQSELRMTLRHDWGGFEDISRFDTGFYYHF